MNYRWDASRRERLALALAGARGSTPPVEAMSHAPPTSPPNIAWSSVFGVGVALLALVVSAMAFWLSWSERDTPFVTQVYERQLDRVIAAIDFVGRLRYVVTDLETQLDVGIVVGADADRQVRALTERWSAIVSEGWVFPVPIREGIATAAADFNAFAALCLRNRYDAPAAIGPLGERRFVFDARCTKLFEAHQASATALEAALSRYIGFDDRSRTIVQRFGAVQGGWE